MQQSMLSRLSQLLFQEAESRLGLYRLFALFAAICIPVFRFVLPEKAYDPMAFRLAISGVLVLAIFLSYQSAWVRRHLSWIASIIMTILCGWLLLLLHSNDFRIEYLVSFYALVFACTIAIHNLWELVFFSMLITTLGVVASLSDTQQDSMERLSFLGILAVMLALALISLAYRNRILKELRGKSALMESIFHGSPDGIFLVHYPWMEVHECNQNTLRMFGAQEKDLRQLKGHLSAWVAEIVQDADWTNESSLHLDEQMSRLDGRQIWVDAVFKPIDKKGFLVRVSDITEKKLAEESLQRSDHILNQIEQLVLVCNPEGEVIYASPSAREIAGIEPDDLLGNGWWDFRLRYSTEAEVDQARKYMIAIASGEILPTPEPYEERLVDMSGEEKWLQWRDSVTDDGLVIGMGMVNTDARNEALIRSLIFNIAEGSSRASSPFEFYQYIHQEIRRVIDTPNFYIAVYDEDNDVVTFPYYTDAADPKIARAGKRRKAGKGITEYAIRGKKPLLVPTEGILKLQEEGKIDVSGQAIPKVWLGVPMLHDNQVVGLITIQDYDSGTTFNEDHLSVVNFIAGQVAHFVSKRQADEALRLSEQRFRSIYDKAAVGIAQLTPEARFLQVNQRFVEIFGYGEEEVKGESPTLFTVPEDIGIGETELTELLEGKRQAYSKEKRYLHKDGHVIHALLNVSSYRENGEVKTIIGVYEDITKKKRVELETSLLYELSKALEESTTVENALSSCLKLIQEAGGWQAGAAWRVTPDGDNRRIAVFDLAELGVPELLPADLPSEPMLYASDDQHQYGPLNQQARTVALFPIRARQRTDAMLVLYRKTKTDPEEAGSLLNLFRTLSRQIVSNLDKKRAEAAMAESESRFRAITEAAFEGIVIHQGDRILDVNPAFAGMFGYDQAQLRDMRLTDLFPDKERDAMMEKVEHSDNQALELRGKTATGTEIDLEVEGRSGTWTGQPARILAVRDITDRKLIEQSRESARLDARFKAYIQNSSEIILLSNDTAVIQYCSPSVERYTGFLPEHLQAKHLTELFDPDSEEKLQKVWGQALETPGASSRMQCKMRIHGSETRRIAQVTLTNLLEDPLVNGILVSARDVTDIVEAQESMRQSEALFRSLFQQSPDGIFVESEDGYFLDVNEAGCKLHGLSREELIGRSVADFVPEEDRAQLLEDYPKWFSGELQYSEGRSLHADGSWTPVEIRGTTIERQGQNTLILTVRDVTERKKNEQILKENEERFRALVEHSTEAIFVFDMDTSLFIEVNKNAEDLFGKTREALLLESPRTLSPDLQPDGQDSNIIKDQYLLRALEGEMVVFEWMHLHSSGREIPCEIRLNRFPSVNKRLIRGSISDISDRKAEEARLLEANRTIQVQKEILVSLASSPSLTNGDLRSAFKEITFAISRGIKVDSAAIWLLSADNQTLTCQSAFMPPKGTFESGREIQVKQFPNYFDAIQKERVIASRDAQADPRLMEFNNDFLIPQDIRSILDAPFRHNGKLAGAVWTYLRKQHYEWTPEDENFLASVSDLVTLALEAWERKNAESKLAETLLQMKATFDSTRDGILVLDSEGYVLEYNDEFCAISGIPAEVLQEKVPRPGLDILLDNVVERDSFLEAIDSMDKGPSHEDRLIFHMKDKRVIEFYSRVMQVDEETKGVLWFFHDITDLDQVKAALLENEAKFRALFAQANDAILVMEDTAIVDCNDMALEMFDLNRSEIMGKELADLSPEQQPDGVSSQDKAQTKISHASRGEFQFFIWKHRRSDGSVFDAEVSLSSVKVGSKKFLQAIVRDISERVRSEKALRDSERKNKAILDAIPDLMLRLYSDGTILDYKISDTSVLLTGQAEIDGNSIQHLLPDAMARNVFQLMQEALDTGEMRVLESEQELEGEVRDFETRLVRSGPEEALAIIRDITYRKRTEKELRKRNFELDSFVYRASHDLKAPLNSLMGLISLIETESADPIVIRYLSMMNKSVVKLDTFIRDLADFSRNARLETEHKIVDWQALITETMENLQFMESADRVRRQVDIRVDGEFYSDPVRIGIVFNNLVSNAIKYQNLQAEDPYVSILIQSNEKNATIEIRDNGIGIAKEHQEKVFNLFFRASIQSYGSGMGMYIVRNAIDKLKGEIELESEAGKGSTFTVTLPNLGPSQA